VSAQTPDTQRTTESGEITAALYAVKTAPIDAPLHLIGETNALSDNLVKDLQKWENRGWIEVPNAPLLRAVTATIRKRCAVTTFSKAATEDDWKQMEKARDKAKAARQGTQPDAIETQIDPVFNVSGARLDLMTQRLAYRGIRERKQTTERRGTAANISKIKNSLRERTGEEHHEADIWRSIRSKDIRRQVGDFLWKSIHEAHRCGTYWKKIPGYEDRGTCRTCGTTDTLEHILTECRAPGRREIWRLAKELWKKKDKTGAWTPIKIEDVLGAGLRTWRNAKNKRRPYAERLWRILVTESAYLIWKLRCERVIGHGEDENWTHPARAIRARWVHAINERLRLDIAMTHRRFGRMALSTDLVLGTWNGTLRDESAFPDDWTQCNWVLVGIDPKDREQRDAG
ncbi:uncharacterized protein B0H18DRAFT_888756, partial [Fomitopsis serialis]|uniref:uncharacterized protein n=1 Tax=Fomitopsis serialis TaxID=139415 RepID=UPI00200848FB